MPPEEIELVTAARLASCVPIDGDTYSKNEVCSTVVMRSSDIGNTRQFQFLTRLDVIPTDC